MKLNYSPEELRDIAIRNLNEREVSVEDLSRLVYFLQKDYQKDLTLEVCEKTVLSVLAKREVVYAILTGIALDKAAEKGDLEEPLLSLIKADYKLYGIDEIIPLSIVNVYGSIGFTNFGYLDKVKPGIIAELDKKDNKKVNTFLDDLVAAVASGAASKLAHEAETSKK